MQALNGATLASLMPGMNQAIENPDYEEQKRQMDIQLERFRKAYEAAEGAEKTEMERQMQEIDRYRDASLEQMRWLVTEEGIRQYREIMDRAYIRRYGVMQMLFGQADMYNLLDRFRQGQMSLDQFLDEADGKYRLIRLESQ